MLLESPEEVQDRQFSSREKGLRPLLPGPDVGVAWSSHGLHPRASFTRVRPSSPDPSTRPSGYAPVAQLDRASDYGSEG